MRLVKPNPLIFFTSGSIIFTFLLISPVLALFVMSLDSSDGVWEHLVDTVLLKYISNTMMLMIGVASVSLLLAVIPAWIISNYHFPFSKILDWILILPAACPAYLVAYAYTDVLEYAGFVQKAIRYIFNFTAPDQYYFPEVRSLWGAIFVMSFVLYPYIYVLARTAFRNAPASLYETAVLYKKSVILYVGLPLARPAIFAGLALVCMEVVSDFGTVEYFSLETLTLGIFNVWIGMNSITSAAQLSVVTFIFIITLLLIEVKSRSSSKFYDTSRGQARTSINKLNRKNSILAIIICVFPPVLGFIIPVLILFSNSLFAFKYEPFTNFFQSFLNTVIVSAISAVAVVTLSFLVISSSKETKSKLLIWLARLSATGYAFPGTMLAIGVVISVSYFDHLLTKLDSIIYIIPNGFYLGGTFLVLIFAYIVRFQAIGFGAISSGSQKIPPNLLSVSRCLGKSYIGTTRKVTLPLLRPYLFAGGLLVFVDTMKELPMTLLLRPFNFETLATQAYQFAHSELMAEASVPALLIILAGLVPVIFLNNLLRRI
mgnify:FL=1